MTGFPVNPTIAAEMARWISYLGAERRMSPKTLDAYRRDVSQFLAFLADHLGGAPTLKALAKLTPADLHLMLADAGEQHNLDADLLASVVKAESNGNAHAVIDPIPNAMRIRGSRRQARA